MAMKILLIGEYSNLHWTLAEGLRRLGHSVTVVSDGCGWQNNCRDIDLSIKSGSLKERINYRLLLLRLLASFKGYDVVQIISPAFLKLNPRDTLRVFEYLKSRNDRVFLGAFGTDYFYTKACINGAYRYSDFCLPGDNSYQSPCDDPIWLKSDLQYLNEKIAECCDGIIACLYEYYKAYIEQFPSKSTYIPLPINTDKVKFDAVYDGKVRFFIGIQRLKVRLKGSDIILAALKRIHNLYPDITELHIAESLPYDEYVKMVGNCNVLADQLYSYTPGMNALLGMAKGMAVVSGGEEEMYALIGERENKPIINILPTGDDVFDKLKVLVDNAESLPDLGNRSRRFVEEHHNYVSVAQKYTDFWNGLER